MTPRHPRSCLKLGGSLITDKNRPETLDDAALAAACDAVASALADGAVDRLVVVHGGGSFGHHHASEHGVSTTAGTADAGAVMDIHSAMTELNRAVLNRLHERDVPRCRFTHCRFRLASKAPTATSTCRSPRRRRCSARGSFPCSHGDGVATAGAGVTVVSGDELVVELAVGLGARRVGVCSTVPGVLDSDGEVIPSIDSFEAVADALGASDATDVSGGMAAKVRELLALDAPAHVRRRRGTGAVPARRGCRNADRLTGKPADQGRSRPVQNPLFDPRPSLRT